MSEHAESENRVRPEASEPNDPVSRLRAEEPSIPERPSSDYDGGTSWRAWYDQHIRCARQFDAGGRCYHVRLPHGAYCPEHLGDYVLTPTTGETQAPQTRHRPRRLKSPSTGADRGPTGGAPRASTGGMPPADPHPAAIEHPPLTREGPAGLSFDHGEVHIETTLERAPKPVTVVRTPGATAIIIDPSAVPVRPPHNAPCGIDCMCARCSPMLDPDDEAMLGGSAPRGPRVLTDAELETVAAKMREAGAAMSARTAGMEGIRPGLVRRSRPLDGVERDPVYLAGTVPLEKPPGCATGQREFCGCPEGRCWYDEQLARRARVEPAIERTSWLRIVR